jgi:hypothetical protein
LFSTAKKGHTGFLGFDTGIKDIKEACFLGKLIFQDSIFLRLAIICKSGLFSELASGEGLKPYPGSPQFCG